MVGRVLVNIAAGVTDWGAFRPGLLAVVTTVMGGESLIFRSIIYIYGRLLSR